MSVFGIYACLELYTPLANGYVKFALFNGVPNKKNWKAGVMQQTKYHNASVRYQEEK